MSTGDIVVVIAAALLILYGLLWVMRWSRMGWPPVRSVVQVAILPPVAGLVLIVLPIYLRIHNYSIHRMVLITALVVVALYILSWIIYWASTGGVPPTYQIVRAGIFPVVTLILLIPLYLGGTYVDHPNLAYVAGVIGGLVGMGELISRYRDAPFEALGKAPSFLYLSINVFAGLSAFLVLDALDVSGNATQDDVSTWVPAAAQQVLIAGFGAMALFRSSIFIARVGDNDVEVGPAAFLQTMLNAADREVDRIRAKYRAEKVHDYMKDVDAEKAQNALPSFCSHLMQSFSTDDRAAMQTRIDDAYTDAKPDGLAVDSRAYNLGLIIMDYMGEEVLKAGVEALKPQIKNEPT